VTNITGSFSQQILNTLRDMQTEARSLSGGGAGKETKSGESFADHLHQSLNEVNAANVKADKMGMELSTGKTGNIHETMLATTQAELSFNLMVQIRNKALEAYNDIMRMPV